MDWDYSLNIAQTMHYRLRPIKSVQIRFDYLVSHFIHVQIFQIDFYSRLPFSPRPNISDIVAADKTNSSRYHFLSFFTIVFTSIKLHVKRTTANIDHFNL